MFEKFPKIARLSRECVIMEKKRRQALERGRRWRERHPGAGAAASRKYRSRAGNTPWPAKRTTGVMVAKLKSETPCADCGGVFPACCMDFDHLPGSVKTNSVGTMVAHGHNREAVLAEIAKCDLVCANCHRIRTASRRRKAA